MKIAPTASLFFLIIANLVPVFGVITLGWDVGTILLLYWLESVIIGILNLPKIWMTAIKPLPENSSQTQLTASNLRGALFLSLFFLVHFGMFNFGHITILKEFFPDIPDVRTLNWRAPLALSALGLLVSHGFSFVVNFIGKREYLAREPGEQMFTPYPRVFIMHFTVILGGAMVEFLGAPVGALLILIALKLLVDISSHHREHEKARERLAKI